jgi:hypothetical protein
MTKKILQFFAALLVLSACSPAPSPQEQIPEDGNLPQVTAIRLDREALPRYESLEMTVTLEAQYEIPMMPARCGWMESSKGRITAQWTFPVFGMDRRNGKCASPPPRPGNGNTA